MEAVIQTRDATKTFGAFTAVEGVSLDVRKGEIYGFLGLNGAGKTTTIRMLLGLIRPTSGSIRVLGEEIRVGGGGPWDRVGSLVEVPAAWPELTVRENLDVFRRLRRIEDTHAVDAIMEKLRLTRESGRKARHLSLGNAQRLGLAKALLHSPDILILDEPANGLDPAGIVEIRELLIDLARNHAVTIFVSSHILDEISRLATRVGIIHRGKLLQEVSTAELDSLRGRRLLVSTRDNARAIGILRSEGFNDLRTEGDRIEIRDDAALASPDSIAVLLVRHNLPPTSLAEAEESLETFFLRKTSDHQEGARP